MDRPLIATSIGKVNTDTGHGSYASTAGTINPSSGFVTIGLGSPSDVPQLDEVYPRRCSPCCKDYRAQLAVAVVSEVILCSLAVAFLRNASQGLRMGALCGGVNATLGLFMPLNIDTDLGKVGKVGFRVLGALGTGFFTGLICRDMDCESNDAPWGAFGFLVGTMGTFMPEISHGILRCKERSRICSE